MEIEIKKHKGKNQPDESQHYPILQYEPVAYPKGLILISDGTMHNHDGTTSDYHEIFKVQFIASCKTDFIDHPLLMAFYIGEYGELYPHLLSSLNGNYYQGGEKFILIDYKSYSEICDYTGETKLSFSQYFKEIKSGTLGTNTLLNINDNLLNKNQQSEHYQQEDISKLADI